MLSRTLLALLLIPSLAAAQSVVLGKDRRFDRASGGGPVVSRHPAAAATEDSDGSCCHKNCTFRQQQWITSGFGPLELTNQEMKRRIRAENVNK